MSQVTFYNARYRNKAFTGCFELVQSYTSWVGDRRRVGTAGPGYLKVRNSEGQTMKVTVAGPDTGYVVVSDPEPQEVVALRMEIEVLRAKLLETTGRERENLRKRLARRVAKLETMVS